jgi:hypothetical protein
MSNLVTRGLGGSGTSSPTPTPTPTGSSLITGGLGGMALVTGGLGYAPPPPQPPPSGIVTPDPSKAQWWLAGTLQET